MLEIVDVARRYGAAVHVRSKFGMRGYGVYCAIAGLIDAAPERKIRYDVETFAWELREDKDFVQQVIEASELFIFEDGYIIDSFLKTPEIVERERQELARQRRSEAAKKAAATRKANKEASSRKEPTTTGPTTSAAAPEKKSTDLVIVRNSDPIDDIDWEHPLPTYASRSDCLTSQPDFDMNTFYERFEDIRAYWNDLFIKSNRPSRAYHDLQIPSTVVEYLKETFAKYTNDEIKRAFDYAAKQEYIWQFHFTVKAYNIRKLLCEEEQNEWKEEESITPEQRELLQFLEDQGIEEYEVAKRGKKKSWQRQ